MSLEKDSYAVYVNVDPKVREEEKETTGNRISLKHTQIHLLTLSRQKVYKVNDFFFGIFNVYSMFALSLNVKNKTKLNVKVSQFHDLFSFAVGSFVKSSKTIQTSFPHQQTGCET